MTGFCIETWHFSSSIILATMWNRTVGPQSVTGLIHDNSLTMKWTRKHYVFFVGVYVTNGNSVVTTTIILHTFHHSSRLHSQLKCHKSTGIEPLEKSFSLQKKTSRQSSYGMDTKKCWSVGSTKCSARRHYTSLHYLIKVQRLWNKNLYFLCYKNCNFLRMNWLWHHK